MDEEKILYRPSIEPERHYESEGSFEHPKLREYEDPIPYSPSEDKKSDIDLLLEDLKTVYNLLPFFPIQIRSIIETMIVTITTDTIIRIDPPDPVTPLPPEKEDPEKFIPVFPKEDNNKSNTPKTKDDDPFGFPDVPVVDVKQGKSQNLDKLVYSWTKGNLVRVKKHWIERLKDYLQDYLSKMFHAVQLAGAEDITVLLLAFDGLAVKTTSGKKCKVAHDTIVRNELLMREKAKMMAKLYGADELIRFMRSIEACAQTRQEYYNHEFLSYCPTMLSQYENDFLRSYRNIYDQKYVNSIYQYNKLLLSSAELTKDVFDLTVESALAKGVLINNNINPFEQTPVPDPVFYLNSLTPEPGKVGANGLSSTGNYGNVKPGSLTDRVLNGSGGTGQIDTDFTKAITSGLIGQTMDNGTDGCVEFATKFGSYYSKFLANELANGVVGVSKLISDAAANGLNVTSGTPSKGDIIVYGDSHVVIADGAGGYYGNSSSQNQAIHGGDYTQMGGLSYTGFIPLNGK